MYYRLACSIPDPSSATVLVTGGFYTPGNIVSRYGRDGWRTVLYCIVLYCTALYCTVSRYGSDGWLEDLPSLNVGRAYHGCGSYVSDRDLVSTQWKRNN